MPFINPKTDFAFKKIFGSSESTAILKSFLNAMLYDEKPAIASLEILDPYLAPKIRGVKDTYVDVRATLQNGHHVIIEMQVLYVAGFEKRVLYNAAKAYSTQLPVGENYEGLRGVIALTFTDFIMFPDSPPVKTAFALREKTSLMEYEASDLELVFVELPKFNKKLEELESVTDKWLFFLKSATSFKMAPEKMTTVPEIRQAFEMAERANLSPEELDDVERREMFISDMRNFEANAEKRGLARGMERGLEQGIAKGVEIGRQEGRQEGFEKGALEKAEQIARGLKGQLSDSQIADLTGLPLEVIRAFPPDMK
jgi:predicted transposase/invertase (TIGR01784 family)